MIKSFTLSRVKSNSIILILLFYLILASCKMSSVSMQILIPADINIPSHIKKVGIANRSLPEKENMWKNVLEGFLTGESIFADREGSENCIRGLAGQLNNSPRFVAVLIEGEDLRGTGTRQFPFPLDPVKIDQLCERYGVDALILLETFDSDIRLNKDQRTVEKTDKAGKKYNEIEYLANIVINVNAGWRVYDYQQKRIVDENSFTDEKHWNGSGSSPQTALNALPSKRHAINDAGYFAGGRYGFRISPGWVNASRSYYVKGNDDFKKAKRCVRVNDWDSAATIWKNYLNTPDPKIAGRATFNMALASEMKGDLQIALDWANKAYLNFGLKKAKSYSDVLNRRINDQERLNKQMEGQ